MIQAVIFDLDNTLLDFISMKNKSISSAIDGMIEAGLSVDPKEAFNKIFTIYDNKGYEYQEVLNEYIINELGSIDYKILANGIVAYKKAKEASLVLYPNVIKTLVELSKMGLKLGVVSDAPKREAWIRICSVNLHHMFDAVVTFDDTGFHKPSPEPFRKIIKDLKVVSNTCFMIGDWPDRDIKGAKELGMITGFAKYGDTFNTLDSGAAYDLKDISELIPIILKLNKKC